MTALDRAGPLAGYFSSPWPVECGGNRRQKAAAGGLNARTGTADVVTRKDARWHVMAIRRAPGEVYVGGTMPAWSGPEPHGWLQRIDPDTLEPLAESPELPAGGHVWCGAIAAHVNGDIYKVNGCYMHRLDADCQVVTERRLPVDQAHNGLLTLSDGSIVTKDLRLAGQGPSTVTRLSPDGLTLIGEPLRLPEGSMGRIASDLTEDGEFIYIPGIEHVWRIRVDADRMTIDPDWSPVYRREGGSHGLSWDGCISDGSLWLMDNGDIDSLRAIYGEHPNGRFEAPSNRLSWRRPAPWSGAQRLIKVSLDTGDIREIEPFGTPGGGIIAPPVHVPEHGICIAWDSINGGLAGIADDREGLRVAWTLDARPSMQPVVFPETGELVINDFRDNDDRLIVVDIPTGEVIDDVGTGSRVANGMFLTPGGDRDVYYCSTFAVARVRWR
jgi:hypothetical protein